MKHYFPIVCLLLLAFISSCDVVQPPFTDNNNTTNPVDDTTGLFKPPYFRKVLVEEFTGFHCGNCPEGADKIKQLLQQYKDTLIAVSIHAGDFAEPYPSGSKFRTDFRTDAGNLLNDAFSSGGYPAAIINRNTNKTQVLNKWATIIDTLLNNTPEVHIGMKTTYDAVDSTVSLDVGVKYLKAGANKERLAVYMVEDSVMDWQLDTYHTNAQYPNGEIPNYTHRHVMRGDVADGAWGRLLDANASLIAVGTKFTKGYTYSFRGRKFRPENCHIIALVYDENTKRIRQASEVKVIE